MNNAEKLNTNMKKKSFYPNHFNLAVGSYAELLYGGAEKYGDKPCYRYLRGGTEYSVSYRDFARTVSGLCVSLDRLSVSHSHIAIIGEKCYEWLAAYFAVITGGGVAVPLDKDLAKEQIRNFIAFADCDTVIYTPKYRDVFEDYEFELPGVRYFIEMESGVPISLDDSLTGLPEGKNLGFAELVRYGLTLQRRLGEEYEAPEQDTGKMSIIIFTSGTTGTSKGVMLSQRNVLSCLTESLKIVDIRGEDTLVSVLPLHHTYEMVAGILAAYAVGATVCINDSIRNTTRDFKYFKPTIIALVPLFVTTIYKKIMDTARKNKLEGTLNRMMTTDRVLRKVGIDLRGKFFSKVTEAFGGRLTRIVCGGAPMSPEMIAKFASLGISLAEGYGITECSPVIAVSSFENPRKKSCGLLLPTLQLYVDKDDPRDIAGELVVKGDSVMLGYYKNEAATDEVLDERGWFHTGDCGYIDSDSYVYITGRKKNVIVLENGKNVFPEEIEESLESIILVKECAVVARRSSDGHINVTAIIYPDYDRATEEGIAGDEAVDAYLRDAVAKLNKKTSSFKQIRGIEVRRTPFPKTTTQKIQRHKIDRE